METLERLISGGAYWACQNVLNVCAYIRCMPCFIKIIVYLLVTVYLVYEKYKVQIVVVTFYLSIMLHHIQFSQQRVLL